MDRGTFFKTFVLLMLALLISTASAQTAKDLVGEGEFKMDMQGREMLSQVEFTLKEDGTLAGKWTSSGMGGRGGAITSELANIKFAEGKITFDRTISFGEQDFTMSYAGVYKDGTITGGFSTEMGEMPTNGTKKAPPIVIVGEWEFVMQFGNRGGQRAGQRVQGQERPPRPPTKIVFAKKEDGTFTGTWEGGMMGGRGGQRGGQRAQAADRP